MLKAKQIGATEVILHKSLTDMASLQNLLVKFIKRHFTLTKIRVENTFTVSLFLGFPLAFLAFTIKTEDSCPWRKPITTDSLFKGTQLAFCIFLKFSRHHADIAFILYWPNSLFKSSCNIRNSTQWPGTKIPHTYLGCLSKILMILQNSDFTRLGLWLILIFFSL